MNKKRRTRFLHAFIGAIWELKLLDKLEELECRLLIRILNINVHVAHILDVREQRVGLLAKEAGETAVTATKLGELCTGWQLHRPTRSYRTR